MRTLGQPANASHPSTRGTLPSPGKQGGGGVGWVLGRGQSRPPTPKPFGTPAGGAPPRAPSFPPPPCNLTDLPPVAPGRSRPGCGAESRRWDGVGGGGRPCSPPPPASAIPPLPGGGNRGRAGAGLQQRPAAAVPPIAAAILR